MTEGNDVLVADYLAQVSRATAGLPAERRDELMQDLREHIDGRRAELDAETEAQVRQILVRLGDPVVIAAAAAEDADPAPPLSWPIVDSGSAPAPALPWSQLGLILVVVGVVIVVALLCAGGLLIARSSGGSAM